jgi:hypothetical protein
VPQRVRLDVAEPANSALFQFVFTSSHVIFASHMAMCMNMALLGVSIVMDVRKFCMQAKCGFRGSLRLQVLDCKRKIFRDKVGAQ